jgi:peptide/nickel transport system substrate-binding protein
LAFVATLAVVAAACGGGSSKGSSNNNGPSTTQTTSGVGGAPNDTSTPVPGGSVTMALPAESSGGWCLPEAQLSASGIQVARAIYDTLTIPDSNDKYVGDLASSVTSNAAFTAWTIHLRSGIVFQDGSPFNAQDVKDNLDAYRGTNPKRNPLLFKFVFQNIKSTSVVDNLTVRVDMVKPWSNFPASLYSYGRLGMLAEKQLGDGSNCFTDMIGTGPFAFKGDWVQNDHLTVVKNPNYWRKDKTGQKLPYLDKIVFKPVPETSTMENGLESSPPQFDLALTDSTDVVYQIQNGPLKSGSLGLITSGVHPEVAYTLFNDAKPPFNNILARKAFAYAVNRNGYNKLANQDLLQLATGPFGPGTLGYVANTGLPEYNPTLAKSFAAQYTAETHQPLAFTYSTTSDPVALKDAQIIGKYMQAVGISMSIKQVDEATLINYAIAGTFQASVWRNHPGFDPDTQWVWWHCDAAVADQAGTTHAGTGDATHQTGNNCDNLVNFSKFNDAVINHDFEVGRSTTNAAVRKAAYEDMNKEFAKQIWEGWGYYSLWTIPYATDVRGMLGPNLPTATSPDAVGNLPYPGLSSGVDPSTLWLKK